MDVLLDQIGAALDGIVNAPIVRLMTSALLGYWILVWLASAWWVLHDMRRRHEDPALSFAAAAGIILASPILFPLAIIVYRIVRPGETMAEARERELTERLEEIDADMQLACPGCSRRVEEDWLACPACRTRLAHRCANCGRTMGLDWTLCGWCGQEFGRGVRSERLLAPSRSGPTIERGREGSRTEGLLEPGA